MTKTRPRNGVFAAVGGVDYACNSAPENGRVLLWSQASSNPDERIFHWSEPQSAWLGNVKATDCDEIFLIATVADFDGLECDVVSFAEGGEAGLVYVGPQKTQAFESGFHEVEPGLLVRTVPRVELSLYRELRFDLLFQEKVARMFP